MTEVLPAPSDGATHFSTGSIKRSTSAHNLFLAADPSSYIDSSSKSSIQHAEYSHRLSSSLPSSAPSSPQLSHSFSDGPSYASTPASSLSLDTKGELEDTNTDFPAFDGPDYFGQHEGLEPPRPPSPISNDSEGATPSGDLTVPEPGRPSSPEVPLRDDNTIEKEPTRHVDYLSHEWREEDIWSSWRYIVSRRGQFSNGFRLENASWRTWTKVKYHLQTVSPEKLNWLKDCDVTWLYGPLQTDSKKLLHSTASPPPSQMSTSNSFLNKKPILKKRSASEAMLQRSLSAHTLLQHAGAILQAQEASSLRSRPSFNRSRSEFTPVSPTPLGASSVSSVHTSSTPSGAQSPPERRHIHFNNEVSQCIAVEAKDLEYDEDCSHREEDEEDDEAAFSDDNVLMMKDAHDPNKAKLSNRSTPRSSFSTEKGPTIAHLPSTRLRGETPEPPSKHSEAPASESLLLQAASFWSSNKTLKESPSEETLRPSRPSTNFLLDEDEDADLDWPGPSRTNHGFSFQSSQSSESNYEPGPGMRRTPSGMFMPYEEDEDDVVAAGLFGRVVDTVNTARDIAHVIWNVGWRR